MVLINYVTSEVFELFSEAENYEEAINILKSLYIKTPNEMFARYALATRKQQPDESIDEYLQILKIMSKDCNFQQATANQYRDEAVRDAFISGLLSNAIRQRLWENKTLNLETAFGQARALDSARKSSDSYRPSPTPNVATTALSSEEVSSRSEVNKSAAADVTNEKKCYFCGLKLHPRTRCSARDATCSKCHKLAITRKHADRRPRHLLLHPLLLLLYKLQLIL